MKSEKTVLAVILFGLLSMIGWILNMVQLVAQVVAWDEEYTNGQIALIILKGIGVFAAPLGVVLGYIGLL